MSKSRDKTRANRKRYKLSGLAFYNEFGVKDPTPYEAIKNIINENKKGVINYDKS